jgi:ABC-type uncharacterized transport system permease subunit
VNDEKKVFNLPSIASLGQSIVGLKTRLSQTWSSFLNWLYEAQRSRSRPQKFLYGFVMSTLVFSLVGLACAWLWLLVAMFAADHYILGILVLIFGIGIAAGITEASK